MPSEYNSTTEFLQNLARDALQQAENNASRIYSLPPQTTLREPTFNVSLTEPNLGPPPSFDDLFGQDNTDPTVQYMNGQADAWMDKYFPEINACLKTLPEEFLCNIISGVKPYGQDKTYFELAWQQGRDRLYRTVASEKATLSAEFSSRGFSLPPGAFVDAMIRSEQKATDAALDINRDQSIKDADIKLDLLKFAEEQAIRLKLGVMQALSDFYRQWINIKEFDVRSAQIRAQAQAALYGALQAYYGVEISFQELLLKSAQTKAGVDIDVDRNRLDKQRNFGSTASALGTAVSAFANTSSNAAQAGSSLTAQIEGI